jgi:hypothetical protein
VDVTPADSHVLFNASQTLTATAYDATNTAIPDVSFAWGSSNPDVATISTPTATTVSMTGAATGVATITATPTGGPSGQATATVDPGPTLVFDRFSGLDGTADRPQSEREPAGRWTASGPQSQG